MNERKSFARRLAEESMEQFKDQVRAAIPLVVPPPEWADPRRLNTGAWAITGDCGCFVRGGDAAGLAGYPCERHTFAALDSGLALLRGALAQQEKE